MKQRPRRPRKTTVLVFAYGEREGRVVRPEDLTVGAEQTFAWAMQAGTGVVRNGTRLYQILRRTWRRHRSRARSKGSSPTRASARTPAAIEVN